MSFFELCQTKIHPDKNISDSVFTGKKQSVFYDKVKILVITYYVATLPA